ncbi:MAG: squalene--hopene cyclase [Candidatus Omnitrophica bacterium CG11_big_fil_rev_8_21_14_0_20_64_10]|nr:MAG: squalene--hopene cyclase [Candidatus Omnitrophica bacterium CG11_big_fil_rev_8_21_14_0_20_64_10]
MPVDLASRPEARPAGAGPEIRWLGAGDWTAGLRDGIERTVRYLLSRQEADGHWVDALEGDTSLESDTIKLWHWLGEVDEPKQRMMVRSLLEAQLPDGGWPVYEGGPANLNSTVKAYAALRLSGISPSTPVLQRARMEVLRLGGLERVNSFEKVYLALFGAYPWDQVPALPPEVILLPDRFPFGIYEVAYWSRTILIPLAIATVTRPMAPVRLDLEELWCNPQKKRARITNFQRGGFFWRGFFLAANHLLKWYERRPLKFLRRWALQSAERWMLERMREADGLGAIYPAMVNAVFALKGLGYKRGNPAFETAVAELRRLERIDGGRLKVQPCFSPVWDTAIAAYALGKDRSPGTASEREESVRRAAGWLLARELRQPGDWAIKNPGVIPSGWAFMYRNPLYPDVDDAAQVLLAFSETPGFSEGADGAVMERGWNWILSMQNADGGFSSYDKNNNRTWLGHFPFADHNAMLDPSACDITGRVLELAGRRGLTRRDPRIHRAVAFLLARQEMDGTWFGRWGVNYIYGTWLALRGLKAVGEPMSSLRYQRAGRWLIAHQNADGGWGETCGTYDDPATKGRGPSTPSQTAWAVMTLLHLQMSAEPALKRGVEYLLKQQRPDGNWPEEPFTGTGFPRVFYLKYPMYRTYFPLLALIEAGEQLRRNG